MLDKFLLKSNSKLKRNLEIIEVWFWMGFLFTLVSFKYARTAYGNIESWNYTLGGGFALKFVFKVHSFQNLD